MPIASLRFFPLLVIGAALAIGSGDAVAADAVGADLATDGAGSFGPLGAPLKTLIDGQLGGTGLGQAVQLAQTAVTSLAQGKVPVISELQDPFHGDVGAALDNAFNEAKVATGILGAIDPAAAQTAFDLLRNSPLVTDGDIGFSTPVSRTRILRKGNELSVCTTVVGPGGSRITTGMSNAAHLCGVIEPRMANPGGGLVLVTDLAVGYTHVQTRLPLVSSLGNLLATPEPLLQGETYVKVNGQWLQIKLTGADPATVVVEVQITIGVKGGVNYALYLEGEGAVTLTFNVKPFLAAEVIGGVAAAVTGALATQHFAPTDVLDPAVAASALLAGLNHLNNDPLLVGQNLGYVQIVIDALGQLGIGISDTGLAGASASGSLTTTIPLGAITKLGANELANLIQVGLGASDTIRHLSQGLLEGQDAAKLQTARDAIGLAASDFVTQVLPPILAFTDDVEVEFAFKLGVLGRVGKGTSSSGETKAPKNITLIHQHVNIPVGKMARLLANPVALADRLRKAADAASKVVMFGVGQASAAGVKLTDGIDFVITPPVSGTNPAPSTPTTADFSALTGGLLDDVRFTFLCMGAPLTLTGVRDVSLGALMNLLAERAPLVGKIVTGIVLAASTGNFDALRGALEQVAKEAYQLGLDTVIEVLKTYKLPLSIGFGGNVDLGAGAVVKLGLGGKVDGEVKLSLLLLLIGSKAYNEPDGTTLASLNIPVAVSLTGGASIGTTAAGAGASLTVDAGGTLSANFMSLTLKQWNGALPPPAAMRVAGFEVLDFTGTVNQDESFAGDGFLLLPMGGLVHAWFSVDAQKHVLPGGHWTGGFELGPLGTLTLAQGTLDDDGIHGVITVKMLDSSFLADFLLQSTGRLYGHYAGTIVVGGLTLANVTLDLGRSGSFAGHALTTIAGNTVDLSLTVNPDGTSSGHYFGDLVLAGRTWSSTSLDWNGTGFTGTCSTNIFGNTATFALNIGADGTFLGSYAQGASEVFGIGGAGLSGILLAFSQAGFQGSATLTLPGIPALRLTGVSITADGKVTGRYTGLTNLAGFSTWVDLALQADGLHGTGRLDALGTTFTANNLFIGTDGSISGAFTGTTVIGGHTLSSISLALVNGSLTGTGTTDLLGNTAHFSLVIATTGQVNGTYRQGVGEVFGIGGLGLEGVVLNLTPAGVSGSGALSLPGVGSYNLLDLSIDAQGHASGTLSGSTSLFGFDTTLTLKLSETGLLGNGTLAVLGSQLQATNLTIDASGRVQGTFSGSFVSAGQTISVSTLVVGNDSLTGTTHFDIPGVSAAQVSLMLKNGEVTARYESKWNLFGVGSALAQFTLYTDRIVVHAQMQNDFIQSLRTLVLGAITDAVTAAQGDLAFARSQLAKAQVDVDNLNGQIAATFAQIDREKAAARKFVEDAEAAANSAWASVLGVLDQVAAVNARFAAQLGNAQNDVQRARNDLANARNSLGALDSQISNLDSWYWGQDANGRFWSWLYYQGARGILVLSRGIASLALDSADGFLGLVQNTLGGIQYALQNELQPLLQNKAIRQQALDDASKLLAFGRQTLESIPLDPELDPRIIGLRFGQLTATGALNLADGFLHTASQFMGGILVVSNFIDSAGSAALIDVRAARFDADLGALTSGRVFMEADVVYMGLARHVGFNFDFFNPLGSAVEMSKKLTPEFQHDQTPAGVQPDVGWNDTVPPTTFASGPSGWQRGDTTISLRALDSVSGVAVIIFSASGAQSIGQTVVAASTAALTISAEGVTTVTYTARDRAGNTAAAKTIFVSIDRTAPLATASAPGGWQKDRAVVQISATDSGSGVASIAYSVSGAMTTSLATFSSNAATVEVAAEGVTTVQYSATDVAGNVGVTGSVTVKVDRTAPVSTLQEPGGWRNAPVDVAVTAQDALSGVASISWSAAGGQSTPVTLIAGGAGNIHIASTGVTTVTYFATDNAGNVEAARTFTVKIDTLAPVVSGTAPSTWQNHTVFASFSAVDEQGGSGVASITVSATGAQPSDSAVIPGASTTVAVAAEGVTTVYFSATDNAGNVSATKSITVRIDLTNPVTTASAPSAWQRGTTTVRLSATDNLSGVASITFSANGAQTIAPTIVSSNSTSLPISAEGVTIVSYFATDVAGNVEAAGSITVRIDLTNPVTTATAPSTWQNRTVTVGLGATDNLSGVASITYSATGAQTIASTRVAGNTTSFPISAEGITIVSFFATDVAGNVEAAGSITVRIDLTNPVTTATAPSTWQNRTVTVGLGATDNLSGVASITYSATGAQTIASTRVAGNTTSFPISAEGITIVSFFATDIAGNVEAAGSITVLIDLTNPVTTATAPSTWQNRTVTVGLGATDNLSGVASITYSATGAQTIASTRVAGNTTAFPISAEGTTTVSYFAIDIAGNVEAARAVVIRIDLTKPVLTFAGDHTYTVDLIVNVSCSSTDNLSGVASDTCAAAAVNAPAYTFALGSHPVSATAIDVAGNIGTASSNFAVIVTYPSLINLTKQFVAFAGTQNDLLAKLNAASASRDRGNKNSESGQMGAYRNAVSAQSGKRLTPAQAAILIKLANSLLAQ